MQLDLSAEMIVEDLDVNYGEGLPHDIIPKFDFMKVGMELLTWYEQHKGEPDEKTCPQLREFLISKGFVNLPNYMFAGHSLAGYLVKQSGDRKKKYRDTLQGPGGQQPEWGGIIPDSPA